MAQSHPGRWDGVKTCNFSCWRDDLLRVNGFDDVTLAGGSRIRTSSSGSCTRACPQERTVRRAGFPLWHAENDRTQLAENRRRLEEILASDRVAAVVGLDQYA